MFPKLKEIVQMKGFKNVSVLTFSEIIIRAAKFVLLAVVARQLGPEAFGIFNYVLALAALVAIVGDFGINRIITRNVSRDNKLASEYIQSFMVQFYFLSLICILSSVYMFFANGFTFGIIFLLLTSFTAINVLGDYIWSFYRAFEEMSLEAVGKSIQAILIFILGLLFIASDQPLIGLSAAYVIGAIVTLALGVYMLHKVHNWQWKPNFRVWFGLISKSWPIAIVTVSAFVFNQIDTVMLGLYGQFEEVGFYNAAYRIIGGLLIPLFIFDKVLYPKFSRYNSFDSKQLVRKNQLANLIIYLIALVGIYIFGANVLTLVYGVEYAVASQAFNYLGIALLLTSLTYPLSSWAIARNYLKLNLILSVAAAGINVSLNVILIPLYSYEGAAIATALTYAFLLVGYSLAATFIVRRN